MLVRFALSNYGGQPPPSFGQRNSSTAAHGVAPWQPVVANQREGQVDALFPSVTRVAESHGLSTFVNEGRTRITEHALPR